MKRNVQNKVLLLSLLQSGDGVMGATRLQKLILILENIGRDRNIKTFNYEFIRWHYGPYCSEIKNDIEFLKKKGLISTDSNYFEVTDKGRQLLNNQEAIKFIEDNNVGDLINDVLYDYGTRPLDVLLNDVYSEYKIETEYEKGDIINSILDVTL